LVSSLSSYLYLFLPTGLIGIVWCISLFEDQLGMLEFSMAMRRGGVRNKLMEIVGGKK
jgi:hypothetical protein